MVSAKYRNGKPTLGHLTCSSYNHLPSLTPRRMPPGGLAAVAAVPRAERHSTLERDWNSGPENVRTFLDGPNGSGGTTLALKPSALALETPEVQ